MAMNITERLYDPRNPLEQIKRDFAEYKRRLIAFLWSIKGRFLSNTTDPDSPHARMYHIFSFHSWGDYHAEQREYQYHLDWIDENITDRPKGTKSYSVEALEKMELVGIYQPLFRTLGSVDQISWWIFGMKKPTIEKFFQQLQRKVMITKAQIIASLEDLRVQLANFWRYVIVVAQTFNRVPLGLAIGDYVRSLGTTESDKSWVGDTFLLKRIELPYLIVSDLMMGEDFGYENFKNIRLDLREHTVARVEPLVK